MKFKIVSYFNNNAYFGYYENNILKWEHNKKLISILDITSAIESWSQRYSIYIVGE